MKVAIFSSKSYEKEFFDRANRSFQHELVYLEPHLGLSTISMVEGFSAVSVFVNDQLNSNVIQLLKKYGISLIALRCAGYNNVDLAEAKKCGITVARVPAYSPYAVAEHTVGLILGLNRKIHRTYNRVREGNFSLEGLMGFDIHGKTVGIIGTGRIGTVVAQIMKGFGCNILAYDPYPNQFCIEDLKVSYVKLPQLFTESDIITLHCPLTPDTYHVINETAIVQMKTGVMLINTSRGAVIDTRSVINALKAGKIGYLGLDVYEEETDLFFEDLSNRVIKDDLFTRLLTFPNVIVTGHQAFFTKEAMEEIAKTTLANISEFEKTNTCANQVFATV